MSVASEALAEQLRSQFAECLCTLSETQDHPRSEMLALTISGGLLPLMTYLRDHADAACHQLTDITAVDWIGQSKRFVLVYHLLSLEHNFRLRVQLPIDEGENTPSLTPLFPVANWLEREVWDMYGIFFLGHPDLRRILTDYGFQGHPLRKDFPLTGEVEVRYDATQRRVVTEPVQLAQSYRDFDFQSPWRGMDAPVRFDAKTKPRTAATQASPAAGNAQASPAVAGKESE